MFCSLLLPSLLTSSSSKPELGTTPVSTLLPMFLLKQTKFPGSKADRQKSQFTKQRYPPLPPLTQTSLSRKLRTLNGSALSTSSLTPYGSAAPSASNHWTNARLKENGICFKCCSTSFHIAKNCKSSFSCSECESKSHNTSLHPGPPPGSKKQTILQSTVGRKSSHLLST
jgi:hypothetical protein